MTCGRVMLLPGEESIQDRPVEVTLFLDRRGPRDGSQNALPQPAMGLELSLDRREEPRLPVVSPLGPIRPVAEAAANLLRHVAAVAPVEDDFEVDVELCGGEAGVLATPVETAKRPEQLVLPPRPPVMRRLVAWAVDGALVTALPLVALAAATSGVTGKDGLPVPLGTLLLVPGPVQGAALLLAALVGFVYLTLSSVLGGRTPGAALAGLGLVSCESGEPPGLARAALRAALAVAGTFACLAGPLSALLDGRGRALHDKLAGTVVMADR